jgi:hypothetical protein
MQNKRIVGAIFHQKEFTDLSRNPEFFEGAPWLHVTACLMLPLRLTRTKVELIVGSRCRDEDVCVNHVPLYCECL